MADVGESAIEQYKIKRLVKNLNNARGAGTSMISLIVPPKDDISRVNRMLTDEYGTASNIKSRVNRLSVLGAITSTQQRLKRYTRTPPNGLIIYCGTVLTEDGKERKVTFDFEPFKPINTSLYLCDSRFHTECLQELLEADDKFGFLIMDGSGSLYGTVQGSNREVLQKFTVDLPKKHGRGGQSSMRFARLRLEKRQNYVTKVGECATQQFITNDRPNVAGLIIAGSAEFKHELQKAQGEVFDPRLAAIVLATVDISYGGENGFNQAIELTSDLLKNTKLVKEKKLLSQYMDEVARDTGRICFGIDQTVQSLEMGAVENLIVYEELDIVRVELRPSDGEEIIVRFVTPAQQHRGDTWRKLNDKLLDVVESEPFVDWIVTKYKDFGASLHFVSDRSAEGHQFVKGFGGIGGILRYKLELDAWEAAYEAALDSDDEDFADY